MKQFINILVCFTIILFFSACNKKKLGEDPSENYLELSETKSFNDHFLLESVVPIETNENCLITRIRRVILYKDKAIILNGMHEVLIINNLTGEYLGRINNRGSGPGEYVNIIDITFDESRENIILYSDKMKVLFYDLNYNFLDEFSVGDDLYERLMCDDNILYFYKPMTDNDKTLIGICHIEDKKIEKHIGPDKYLFDLVLEGNPLVKSQSIWFPSPLQSNLYKIEKSEVKNSYHLDITNFANPQELLDINPVQAMLDHISKNEICYAVTSIRETQDHIYCKTNRHPLIIIDKKSNQTNYLNSMYDKTGGYNLRYFPHDGSDNRTMFILSAENWLLSKKDMDTFSPNGGNQIEKDSNPFLVFYKVKN